MKGTYDLVPSKLFEPQMIQKSTQNFNANDENNHIYTRIMTSRTKSFSARLRLANRRRTDEHVSAASMHGVDSSTHLNVNTIIVDSQIVFYFYSTDATEIG